MDISLQKIIPFTQARNKLSELIDRVRKEHFFVISRQNRQKAVLVDIDYFQSLQKELEQERLVQIEETLRAKFRKYSKKISTKGRSSFGRKNGKKLTEEEAYQLLSSKKLEW